MCWQWLYYPRFWEVSVKHKRKKWLNFLIWADFWSLLVFSETVLLFRFLIKWPGVNWPIGSDDENTALNASSASEDSWLIELLCDLSPSVHHLFIWCMTISVFKDNFWIWFPSLYFAVWMLYFVNMVCWFILFNDDCPHSWD